MVDETNDVLHMQLNACLGSGMLLEVARVLHAIQQHSPHGCHCFCHSKPS